MQCEKLFLQTLTSVSDTKSSPAPSSPLTHSSHLIIDIDIDIAPAGLPGNDDQATMATLLIWHLLGLYPGQSFTHASHCKALL